jgi:cytochrome P450
VKSLRDFDLRSLPPSFYENPFPFYAALRESDPVRRMPDGSVLLTRYRDVEFVYKNPKLFSSDKRREFGAKYGPSPLLTHHTSSLVFNDPPLHSRVRRLIAAPLTPKAIASIEPALEKWVDELLDRLARRGGGDLIEDFASAIPIEVIGNLLDVPASERGPLREWSLAILGALEPQLTPAQAARGNSAVEEFSEYLEGLIERRRREQRDPEADLLSRLIHGDAGGERLSSQELIHNCIFLLNAGHETTTNLIGNGLMSLLEHPRERRRLIEDPTLIRPAVEEFLRFESSNQLGNRITTQAVDIGRVALEPLTPVTLCIGAANRDPEVFEDPDVLDIGRTPNRHLAFGSGIHQCAGMGVARLEGAVAIGRFLDRFPDYSLAGAPVRGGRARFRGFLKVPVHTAERYAVCTGG